MGYYFYDYGDGAYRRGDSRSGYGYYYHTETYSNPDTGYYHHHDFTETLYGDTVYRHYNDNAYFPGPQSHREQYQYQRGMHYTGPNSQTGFDIYTDGSFTHYYAHFTNYQDGSVVTVNTYGYGGAYGEYVSGYKNFYTPGQGYSGYPYTTYVYAYNGYTDLR